MAKTEIDEVLVHHIPTQLGGHLDGSHVGRIAQDVAHVPHHGGVVLIVFERLRIVLEHHRESIRHRHRLGGRHHLAFQCNGHGEWLHHGPGLVGINEWGVVRRGYNGTVSSRHH